jgi:hypothetical protein
LISKTACYFPIVSSGLTVTRNTSSRAEFIHLSKAFVRLGMASSISSFNTLLNG